MLHLQMTRDALVSPWRPLPDGWAALGGRIRIFQHRAIEALAFGCRTATAFVVRERVGGASDDERPTPGPIRPVAPSSFDSLVAEARRWPLHHLVLELDHRGAPEARLTASDWPIAPLFLAEHHGALLGSWDVLDLYPFVRDDGLDLARTARFLASFEHPYARGTMLDGVQCLTAGATAVWRREDRGLAVGYPAPADPAYPRALRREADVIGAAESILDAALRRWLGDSCPSVAAQLSGGLDSSVVTAAASRRAGAVHTYGLSLPGATGAAQAERRAEVVRRFDCLDTALDAIETPVLSAQGARIRRHEVVPWEEIYYEAFDRLIAGAAAAGDDVMLTGFGGDELLPIYWDELTPDERSRRATAAAPTFPSFLTPRAIELLHDTEGRVDRAPRGYLQRSSQEAIACSSAHFMRHGSWAHHPLATPELVRFCHSLPKEWRAGRRLARELLSAWGCSRQVTHPEVTEDFGELFTQSLRVRSRKQLEQALEAGRLHDLGLVDAGELRRACRAYCDGQAPDDADVPLYAAVIVELTLAALDTKLDSRFGAPMDRGDDR